MPPNGFGLRLSGFFLTFVSAIDVIRIKIQTLYKSLARYPPYNKHAHARHTHTQAQIHTTGNPGWDQPLRVPPRACKPKATQDPNKNQGTSGLTRRFAHKCNYTSAGMWRLLFNLQSGTRSRVLSPYALFLKPPSLKSSIEGTSHRALMWKI